MWINKLLDEIFEKQIVPMLNMYRLCTLGMVVVGW